MLQMEIALKTLDYLNKETEYVPWVAAGSQLGYIHDMVAETELYGAFEVSMGAKKNNFTFYMIFTKITCFKLRVIVLFNYV